MNFHYFELMDMTRCLIWWAFVSRFWDIIYIMENLTIILVSWQDYTKHSGLWNQHQNPLSESIFNLAKFPLLVCSKFLFLFPPLPTGDHLSVFCLGRFASFRIFYKMQIYNMHYLVPGFFHLAWCFWGWCLVWISSFC